jgi:A/G-specific adenine glycosylase
MRHAESQSIARNRRALLEQFASPPQVSLGGPDRNWRQRFRRNLRNWYNRHARDLPWRRTTDPYRIWISEIMLQQTTIAAVVPYFERFLNRFPSVHELAAASEAEVLRFWEGLGYYSRARNLHRTARRIVDEHSGRFPDGVETLQAYPGIGRYTAGAIASFAFDVRAPIVEANTLRLYSRLLGYDGDPRSSRGQRILWEFAEHILPRQSPGRFNQALIELGGTVCTPVDPRCADCPVRSCCRAFSEGTQAEIPRPPSRPKIIQSTEATVAIRKGTRYLLRRRGEGELWAGLWDFPRISLADEKALLSRSFSRPPSASGHRLRSRRICRTLEAGIIEQTGIVAEIGEMATEIRHSVTRYRIHLLCFLAEHRSGSLDKTRQLIWVKPADFGDYPLPVTGRKFAKLLEKRGLAK